MRLKTLMITSAGAALLTSAPAIAIQPDKLMRPDGAEVAMSGTVETAGLETFGLNYGDGVVTVEMDDWDYDADAAPLEAGDDVTVYGYIDDGFYEDRTIEASSVWEAESNTFHYASGADEELDWALYASPAEAWAGPGITLTGLVESVDGREFVLSPAVGSNVEVDTGSMSYNPLDNEGVQRVDEGDIVSVSGRMDEALFDNTELSADSVILLENRYGL